MAIDPSLFYGTVAGGDTYFSQRLHESDWSIATTDNKEKALLAATQDVDALKFSGHKTPVFNLLETDPNATQAQIGAADATQAKQFPRDNEAIPNALLYAVYEIAHERLRGRDPAIEHENLALSSDGVGSTRVSTAYGGAGTAHLANGIVSFIAWRHLLSLLDDNLSFDVNRV